MEVFGFDVTITLMLVAGLITIALGYDWWCHQYFQRRGIAVASGYIPIFGNILKWRHGVHEVFTDYVKKHGKVVGMYDFRRPVLIISDAHILKNVLVKNFSNFYNRRIFPINPKPLSRGLTMLENEEWKDVRNVVTPSFSASKMRLMSVTINEICDTLVAKIAKSQEDGKVGDYRKMYGAFTMDAIARCGFGLNVDSQHNQDDPFVKHAKKAFDFSLFNPAFMIASAFPSTGPLLTYFNFGTFDVESVKFFTGVTDAACKLRKEESADASKNIDMLQLMMNAHADTEHEDKGTGKRQPLSTDDVTAQAILFFLAGYETTNTLLCFASYLLATNQDIQEKLLAEIDSHAPTRDNLGYEVISKMEYLDMVVSETLRMYPPATIFDRMCNETITYEGLTIEKGLNVFVSLWTLHYDEEYWTNPTKFDPERFSAENKDSIIPCSYMPFGFGPRNCVGMRFALLESKMALVRVMQQYRFDVCAETEIPPTLGKMGFLAPKTLNLRCSPRK
ncbi:cytochrome P450 3A24-like [Asterias amurensis]|uniref:cytochrome P450 3A24-like n=1 Tax=Asterias amurensis TaxID=7602 RepID=UPI003AB1FEFF